MFSMGQSCLSAAAWIQAEPVDTEVELESLFNMNEIASSFTLELLLSGRALAWHVWDAEFDHQPCKAEWNETKQNGTTALFICRRSEQKIWSPLVSEEGKRHPYKMNLASEPQVSAYLCPSSASCFPAWALFG